MDDKQKEITEFFLQSWLNEAVDRSNSFLDNINRPYSQNFSFIKTRMYEEHYVLTATVMSVRFARQLVNHAPKALKEQLQKFIDVTRDAVDVRDMREHSDEYFLGKGRKKERKEERKWSIELIFELVLDSLQEVVLEGLYGRLLLF